MNNIDLENSDATYESLIYCQISPMSFTVQFDNEAQSSSVTSNEYLWKDEKNNDLPLVSSYEIGRTTTNLDIKKRQKHLALVQLLNTWREEDEKEQRDSWEHLKQALDDDRLSGRKLFP